MVTEFLPLDDKMKLLDAFPPIGGQIKVFDMNWKIPGGIDGQVQLFNKLYNLKTVILQRVGDSFPLFSSPEFVPNIGVNCFVNSHGDTIIQKWDSWDIGPYLKRILDSHPDYDGSFIQNCFEIDDERVLEVLRTNPGLKIKLVMGCPALNHGHLLQEERIKRMIVSFSHVCEEFIDSLPVGMTFESVLQVNIDQGWPISDATIQFLEQFLQRTPNLKWLRLRVTILPNVNVNSVIGFISSIKNLEHLRLYVSCTPDHFRSLLEFLLTSRQLPKLKYLDIVYCYIMRESSWIVSALELDIKPGFKRLTMEHECSFGVLYPPKKKFMVRKRTMIIQNIDPRLVDTFNKFPSVKFIEVVTSSDEYRRQCETDLETIRNHLPRHRAVTMTVSSVNDMIYYTSQLCKHLFWLT